MSNVSSIECLSARAVTLCKHLNSAIGSQQNRKWQPELLELDGVAVAVLLLLSIIEVESSEVSEEKYVQ